MNWHGLVYILIHFLKCSFLDYVLTAEVLVKDTDSLSFIFLDGLLTHLFGHLEVLRENFVVFIIKIVY